MIRVLLCLLAVSSASAATVVSLQAVADTHVSAANAASSFGNAGALAVSGTGNANGEFQSLLRFNLATVKSTFDAAYGIGGWTLDSVQLQLTAATPNNPIFNANAAGLILTEWLADDTWVENAVTWNTLPAIVSAGSESIGGGSYSGASSGSVLLTLGSGSGLAADLASGSNASFRLAAGDALVSMVTNSRNFGTLANRPALIFTASPEPGRTLLLMIGCSVLVTRRRC